MLKSVVLVLNQLKFSLLLGSTLVWMFTNLGYARILAEAQAINQRNPIELKISAVTQNGERQNTRQENPDKWVFDGELSLDDAIRYNWKGVDLNLKYKEAPVSQGGYLKIFSETVAPENLLTEQGTDVYPLKISTISERLKPGPNNLQFVYVNSLTKAEYLPVVFSFNFKNVSAAPSLKVLKPDPKAVFMNGVEQEVVVELKNFRLSNNPSKESNVGKMFLYLNEVNEKNFLGKIAFGRDLGTGAFEVKFNSPEFDFSKALDNPQAKLIFVLTDPQEKLLNFSTELEIVTNYGNSLNVGLPKVSILEPKKDRTDLTTRGNDKFLIQIENFEILNEIPTTNSTENDPKKGFLQIVVVSGEFSQPLQPIWTKTDFTLNEIGYKSDSEGLRTVKVQLVNQNFELLKPEAKDTINIIYQPEKDGQNDSGVEVQSNTWRLILIGLTIILIVGGISILIARG